MNILLVEDNPGDIHLAREALKDGVPTPYCLDVVTDGDAAIKMLLKEEGYEAARTPDIIFLDLNIPKRNGTEVLELIKQHPVLKIIPVIIFSTSESQSDIEQCYRLHANCYVSKPLDYDDFVRVIKAVISFWTQVAIMPQVSGLNKHFNQLA